MLSRRDLFAAAAASPLFAQTSAPAGAFTLPKLPYAFDALEPHIDAKTMEIHHDRHHAAYVAGLNTAVAKYPEWGKRPIEEIMRLLSSVPEDVRTAVRNMGGGHINHTFFWQVMKKDGGGEPKGELAAAIDKKFSSYSQFTDAFTKAATGVFGSGWTWLVKLPDGSVDIQSTPNQDNPWMAAKATPLIGIDVWEHAYYLKHQNRRADYVKEWWNVVNWDFASEQFAK